MQNKVFLATLGINLLFLASGCLELGFSLVVRSQMNGPSKDGQDAVRNLVYQTFPLTAGIANGITTLALFIFTLVALMLPTRGWLKTTGYLITLCALFTLCLGVYVWVLTLRLKSEFFPTYLQQDPTVQSLIQTSVRITLSLPLRPKLDTLTRLVTSSNAAGTTTLPRQPLSLTRRVPRPRLLPCCVAAEQPFPAFPTSSSTASLLPSLAS
jgi:hypothetical protein